MSANARLDRAPPRVRVHRVAERVVADLVEQLGGLEAAPGGRRDADRQGLLEVVRAALALRGEVAGALHRVPELDAPAAEVGEPPERELAIEERVDAHRAASMSGGSVANSMHAPWLSKSQAHGAHAASASVAAAAATTPAPRRPHALSHGRKRAARTERRKRPRPANGRAGAPRRRAKGCGRARSGGASSPRGGGPQSWRRGSGGARRTRSGTRTPSSTSCTSARSSTATATASATSAGLIAEARLPAGPRRRPPLAPAVLPVAAARRRLRHRRLHGRPPGLRHARRLPRASSRRRTRAACASSPSWSSTTPPTSTRGSSGAPRAAGLARARLLRLERHRPNATRTRGSSSPTPRRRTGPGTRWRSAYYWHRFFRHQPDLNFDNPRGAARRCSTCMRLLARPRRRRLPARRRPLPLRARGHELREPARDARVPQAAPAHVDERLSRAACCSPRRTSGPRTCAPTSATATSATWRSTSR